jgi:hypothetical protein
MPDEADFPPPAKIPTAEPWLDCRHPCDLDRETEEKALSLMGRRRRFPSLGLHQPRGVLAQCGIHLLSRERRLLMPAGARENLGMDPRSIPGMIGKRSLPNDSAKLCAAAKRFLEPKKAQGCRDRYLAKLRRTLHLFLLNRGEMTVAEVDLNPIEERLGRNGYRPATRKSFRSDLGSFFAWCVRRGYRGMTRLIRRWPESSTRRPPGSLRLERPVP